MDSVGRLTYERLALCRTHFFGMTYILPTQKDAESNLGRFTPRQDGFKAAPLSVSSRCGTPCAAMPFLTTAITPSEGSPETIWDATANRQ